MGARPGNEPAPPDAKPFRRRPRRRMIAAGADRGDARATRMDFDLNPAQRRLRDQARQLAQSELAAPAAIIRRLRSEEHTSELQSHSDLVCRLLLEKKK